jgi:hypothetical protein
MVAPRSKPSNHRHNGKSPLRELAQELGQSVRDGARAVKTEAQTALAAAAGQVRDEAERLLDKRKGRAASQMHTVSGTAGRIAHALRAVKAEAVADYADAAGDALDRAARFVEDAELSDLTQQASTFARRHPAWVIGSLFAAGFIAARVLKAEDDEQGRDDDEPRRRHAEAPQHVRVRRRPRR